MTEQWRKSSHSLTEATRVGWARSSRCDANGGNCLEVGGDWHKSSRSGHDQCVEAQQPTVGVVMVRDSKNVGQQPLTFSGSAWTAFVQGVKEGEFDGGQAAG